MDGFFGMFLATKILEVIDMCSSMQTIRHIDMLLDPSFEKLLSKHKQTRARNPILVENPSANHDGLLVSGSRTKQNVLVGLPCIFELGVCHHKISRYLHGDDPWNGWQMVATSCGKR